MFSLKLKASHDYDVLIAGAGPAGAAAAAHLAGAGLKVALIDQQAFPRDKVCGDFVGPVALLELRRLGVTSQPAYRQSNVIHRAAVHLDGKLMINSLMPEVPGLPTHGAVIPRMTLDAWIVSAAQAAGAHLIENCRVKGYTVDGEGVTVNGEQRGVQKSWRARLLIGADGSSSLVARVLHGQNGSPDNRIIAVRAYYEDVRGPADQCDLYFSSDSFPGYYWLFPTSETSANVGVGMLVKTLPPPTEHLAALLERLAGQDPAFSQRIGRGRRLGKIAGWPLTTYDPASPITAERVLLAGDAAGLINPLNGEGIQYALLSGRWAAETVLEAAAADDFSRAGLKTYAARVDHELRYDMALASLLVQLIRNRSLNPVWMEALRIITTRARVDSQYATVTGGVLAGLLPASQVISGRVIGGTAQQAVFSLGFGAVKQALRGPKHLETLGRAAVGYGKEVALATTRQPGEFVRWSGGVVINAAELAGQVALHLLTSGGAAPRERAALPPARDPLRISLR